MMPELNTGGAGREPMTFRSEHIVIDGNERNKAWRREQKYKTTPGESVIIGLFVFAVASPFLVVGALAFVGVHFVVKFW